MNNLIAVVFLSVAFIGNTYAGDKEDVEAVVNKAVMRHAWVTSEHQMTVRN